ncbi:MAG: triose-phosphate isomerase [Patescibacteria group bacterium]
MQKLIIGNWKMNPGSLVEVKKLVQSLDKVKVGKNVSVAICPPFVYLPLLKTKFTLGAQDAFGEEKGAYTGEISPSMLKNLGVEYVILGHSERRIHIGETDELIAKKIKGAMVAGLKVILCVGEPLAMRKKGMAASKKYVEGQLKKDLSLLKPKDRSKVIVAYEPIWAISTMPGAKPDSPEGAAEMIVSIKKITKGKVIYGGSVNGANARGFLERKEIDGALPGGASLKPEEFRKIIEAAS